MESWTVDYHASSQLADLDRSYPKSHPFTNDENALWSHIELYTTSKTEHPTEEVAHASQSEGVYRAIQRFAGWLIGTNLRRKSVHAHTFGGDFELKNPRMREFSVPANLCILQPFKQ